MNMRRSVYLLTLPDEGAKTSLGLGMVQESRHVERASGDAQATKKAESRQPNPSRSAAPKPIWASLGLQSS
jgi:hypothetical protein